MIVCPTLRYDWKLNRDAKLERVNGEWRKSLELDKGRYRYKFVIDDRWVHDESNPMAECDEYGGMNSILHIE